VGCEKESPKADEAKHVETNHFKRHHSKHLGKRNRMVFDPVREVRESDRHWCLWHMLDTSEVIES
jgi:hypothetical protein